MTFMDSIKTCFAKYVDFNGRATRSEYWWFVLFYVLAYTVLMVLGAMTTPFISVLALGLVLPLIAVGVRRLHDTDRSGWFMLFGLVPILNFVLLYFMVIEGKEPNRFGSAQAAVAA